MDPANAIQLRITTDLDALPREIAFNYQELREGLLQFLSRFDGLAVSEDEARQAAVDLAEIRNVERTIARARIDTKKRYLEPFELFEERAKELEGLCKLAEAGIADQLARFERERAEAKRDRLRQIWQDKLAVAFGNVDSPHFAAFFSRMTDPKTKGCWLNKGQPEGSVAAAMDAEIKRCLETREMIRGMYAEADAEVRAKAELEARLTFDVTATVRAVTAFRAERAALEKAKAEAEERARAAAEAKAARDAKACVQPVPQPAPAPAPAPAPVSPDGGDEDDVVVAPTAERRITITLRVTATKTQFVQLRHAMDAIGVTHERI